MRPAIVLFFAVSFSLNLLLGAAHKQQLYAKTRPDTPAPAGTVLWQVDFSDLGENPRQRLEEMGFSFEKDFRDDSAIELSGTNNRKEIKAREPAFGLLGLDGMSLEEVDAVEVEWGVDQYPVGADWQKQLNREALMVYIFFGEPVAADRFYLPDSPHFIGLFLCENEPPLTPFFGKYYRQTGRFVCLDSPPPGETIRSRFAIAEAYRDYFGQSTVPPVTGIAIEVDTTDLPEGISAAHIASIRLLDDD